MEDSGDRPVSEARIPAHLMAAQLLIDRCPTPKLRKEFIIACYCCGVLDGRETGLLVPANQLETA